VVPVAYLEARLVQLGHGRHQRITPVVGSHGPGLQAHAARQRGSLGLTGTPPAQAHSGKVRLVTTYCPILLDYTTAEAVLASLLNDYRLVVHRLPLSPVRDYHFTTKAGGQFTSSEREHYHY